MIFALAILAVVDLVVGVSNDAVNFLNSAIGSKAIAFKKIMIIFVLCTNKNDLSLSKVI